MIRDCAIRAILSALLCLLSLICPGCGEGSENETIILRVANWGGAQVESDFMRLERQIVREFEEQHPGVSVRVEQIPGHGQYAPKLLMMHVTGSVPDVVYARRLFGRRLHRQRMSCAT